MSSNQQRFETLTAREGRALEQAGECLLLKIPTHVVIKKTRGNSVSGVLGKPTWLDFIGFRNGRAFTFDCKYVSSHTRWRPSIVKKHQREMMRRAIDQGVHTFIWLCNQIGLFAIPGELAFDTGNGFCLSTRDDLKFKNLGEYLEVNCGTTD